MRRVLPALVAAALLLAGCGSSSSGSSSLTSGLSYFPVGSPFMMTVATDPGSVSIKQQQAMLGRIPFASFAETAGMAKLAQLGINYDTDIRPLFGNPVVVGADNGSGGSFHQALFVWVTRSSSALDSLVKKLAPHARSVGTRDGAKLYRLGGAAFALDGATVLIGSTPAEVIAALDRHAHNQGMTTATYDSAVAGLPKNSVIQVFGNLSGVLSEPSAATARRIPWVAALRGYAAAVSASGSGLSFRYHLDTTGVSLSASQLPLAAGVGSPSFAGTMPITVAVRDPAQIVAFIEGAGQAAAPGSYGSFTRRQARLQRKTGANLNSLLSLLAGDLIVNTDGHTTLGRVGLANPAAATRTLSKLATDPRDVFPKARGVVREPGGFYLVKEPAETIALGVVGNQLLVGKATVAQLRSFASAPATSASGAQGAFAFRIALPSLLSTVLRQSASSSSTAKIEQAVFSVLGDLTGWTAASPSGLTGSATLAFK